MQMPNILTWFATGAHPILQTIAYTLEHIYTHYTATHTRQQLNPTFFFFFSPCAGRGGGGKGRDKGAIREG